MTVKLLTEYHLGFLSLKGLSESTLVKKPHCWKSHVVAHLVYRDKKLQVCILRLAGMFSKIL